MDIIYSTNKKYHGTTTGNLGSSGIIFDKIKGLEDDYGITRDIRINFITKAEIADVKKLDYDKFVRCVYRTELEKYDDPNWQSKYLANRYQNRFGENALKLYSMYLITFS